MKPERAAANCWPTSPATLAGALACAARIVAEVSAGRNGQEVLAALKSAQPHETGWARVHDFAWSTLRDYGWGDAVLRGLSQRGVPSAIRPLLLVAVTEWRKGRVPRHALVHETVALAKAVDLRFGGFVNALLRRLDREGERWHPEAFATEKQTDEVAYWRHPPWWIARLRRDLPEAWQQVLTLGNGHPPLGLRVRQPQQRAEVLAQLAQHGIRGEPVAELPEAIWLPQPLAWHELPIAVQSKVTIQDIGAQWAAHWLAPQAGEQILDACAAPGGKSLHLLDCEPTIRLTAIDQDATRVAAMVQRFPELTQRAKVAVTDAATPEKWWDGQSFDAILLDAPCSASGVVRRHPEIKWLRRETDLAAFAATQQRLIEALWPLLKPGGRLLYATCSLFAEENEKVVRRFLALHPEGKWVRTKEGVIGPQIVPSVQNDGFFYALLIKGN